MEAAVIKAEFLPGEQPTAFLAKDAALHQHDLAHHLVWADFAEAELYHCSTSEPCYLESACQALAQRKQGLQEDSPVNEQESPVLTAEDLSLLHFKQHLLWKKSIHSTPSPREL